MITIDKNVQGWNNLSNQNRRKALKKPFFYTNIGLSDSCSVQTLNLKKEFEELLNSYGFASVDDLQATKPRYKREFVSSVVDLAIVAAQQQCFAPYKNTFDENIKLPAAPKIDKAILLPVNYMKGDAGAKPNQLYNEVANGNMIYTVDFIKSKMGKSIREINNQNWKDGDEREDSRTKNDRTKKLLWYMGVEEGEDLMNLRIPSSLVEDWINGRNYFFGTGSEQYCERNRKRSGRKPSGVMKRLNDCRYYASIGTYSKNNLILRRDDADAFNHLADVLKQAYLLNCSTKNEYRNKVKNIEHFTYVPKRYDDFIF